MALELSEVDEIWNSIKNDNKVINIENIIKKLQDNIIVHIDNNENDSYNYYDIHDIEGKYLYSLPASIKLPVSEWQFIADITDYYTSTPDACEGGNYSSGWRIERLTHPSNIDLFLVTYNKALYSDYEDKNWGEPTLCESIRGVANLLGKDIKITELNKKEDYDPEIIIKNEQFEI